MASFYPRETDGIIGVPDYVEQAIYDLIGMCGNGKVRTIKMVRYLQYIPDCWGSTDIPHPLGLRDAKDLVEWVGARHNIAWI